MKKNIFKRFFALLMVLVLCLGFSPAGASAASANNQMMQFVWNGSTYTMYTGQTGSASGISWSCDASGNFTMSFTSSGSFTILDSDIEDATVKVVGGGAGGSSAYGRVNDAHGGSGGAGGQTVEQSVTITPGTAYTIMVGSGGNGGAPSTTGLASWIEQGVGSNGGSSSAFGVSASGGISNGGGAGANGNGAGSAGSNGAGGGGGCIQTFYETDCGNFRPGNWSCFICGENNGYFDYGVSGWTPLYQNASKPTFAFNGGAGSNGGGNGGTPQNDHCGGPRDGADGATGCGGGGGAYASRVYGIWRGEPQSPTGSATGAGFAGRGGNGGSGQVVLSGKANPYIQIALVKSSSNPDMTNGNSCYSLAGAVYGVYSDSACTQLIEELTTDANGRCTSRQLQKAQYYVREISPSQGYLLDSRIYTIPSTGGKVTLNVAEQPGNDPIGISVTKISDDPAATLPSLAGTQFTLRFYGGQYTSVDELPLSPLKTWVIGTKEVTRNDRTIYMAALNSHYKVSGDDFFAVDATGNALLPIGTITVQESKPADGYTVIGGWANSASGETLSEAGGIVLLNITPDPDSPSGASISYNGALKYGNEYTKVDKPVYGGVKVQKCDAETGAAEPQGAGNFADIPFEIVSLNKADITVSGAVYSYGDVVYSGTSNENGYFETAADLLPAGHYRIDEEVAPVGYQLAGQTSVEFDIVTDGELVDLSGMDNGIRDMPIRVDFSLEKVNGDSKEPMTDVLFAITSNSTGERFEFNTNADGRFSSAGSNIHFGADGEGGALLYDSYTIEELPCDANRGFALCEPFVFNAHSNATAIEIVGVKNYAITVETNASFVDGADKDDKTQLAFGVVTVKDTVDYANLTKGLNYKLVTTLWDKTAGELLKDADGNVITAETEFKAKRAVGSAEARISFNADGLAGRELVVFEELYPVGRQRASDVVPELLVEHKDVNDANQTVRFLSPEIRTSAKDADTGEHISLMADTVTIVDTVAYTDLAPGRKYTVTGVLMDKDSGAALLDENGEKITAEAEFIAHNKDGVVEVTFVFEGRFETAKKLVAFEELRYEGTPIAVHTDTNDEEQTIWLPKISTKARVPSTDSQLAPNSDNLVVNDEVSYTGLIPGLEYAVSGQVVDPDSGDVLGGAMSRFVPETADGSVVNELKVSGKQYAGKRLVVYESILLNGKPVAEHNDPADAAQSVYIPQIVTKATGVETGSNWVPAREAVRIKDTILLDNLVPDMEYTVKGEVVLKSNPEKILAVAEGKIIPDSSREELELEFELGASAPQGESAVVFESLYCNGILVAAHKDVNDTEQTVLVPDIHTEATVNGKHIATAASKVTLTDMVSYVNLSPDKEYRLEGTLMDSLSGAPLRDDTGRAITAMTTFSPSAENGKTSVSFIFDASALAGKKAVVFEKLYIADDIEPIATHEDISDEGQTVEFISGPVTGDESQIVLWLTLLSVSVFGIGTAVFLARRKRGGRLLYSKTHRH